MSEEARRAKEAFRHTSDVLTRFVLAKLRGEEGPSLEAAWMAVIEAREAFSSLEATVTHSARFEELRAHHARQLASWEGALRRYGTPS